METPLVLFIYLLHGDPTSDLWNVTCEKIPAVQAFQKDVSGLTGIFYFAYIVQSCLDIS